MAKQETMWKTSDEKLFKTREEAEAHEFATDACRAASHTNDANTKYAAFRWLYLHRKYWHKRLTPQMEQFQETPDLDSIK